MPGPISIGWRWFSGRNRRPTEEEEVQAPEYKAAITANVMFHNYSKYLLYVTCGTKNADLMDEDYDPWINPGTQKHQWSFASQDPNTKILMRFEFKVYEQNEKGKVVAENWVVGVDMGLERKDDDGSGTTWIAKAQTEEEDDAEDAEVGIIKFDKRRTKEWYYDQLVGPADHKLLATSPDGTLAFYANKPKHGKLLLWLQGVRKD